MMKKMLAAAILALAALPAAAQEWTLSTELGDGLETLEALAVGADGTAWAGVGNRIYRSSGADWTLHATLTGWEGYFYGAAALDSSHVWMSGWFDPTAPAGGRGAPPGDPLLASFAGSGWVSTTAVPWTGQYMSYFASYACLTCTTPGDLWAGGGYEEYVFRSSDGGGHWLSFTAPPEVYWFNDIGGAGPNDIWLAGQEVGTYNPCLYHYDGEGWALYTSPFDGSGPWICVPAGSYPCVTFSFYTQAASFTRVASYSGSAWVSLTAIAGQQPTCITASPQTNEIWLATRNEDWSAGSIFYYNGASWSLDGSFPAPVWSLDASYPGVVWAATTGAVYYRGQPPAPRRPWRTDFDGDGTTDIGIFRNATGLWSIRGVTRLYFGTSTDLSVPGDYDGSGTTAPAVFRTGSGLWVVRGVTRAYFGSPGDIPHPGDYTGDGTAEPAVFRPATGLWAIRGVTRAYFGTGGDLQVPGYYGGGRAIPGIFRYSTGLWAIRGVTRLYFGGPADDTAPGDYAGEGEWRTAVFRPGTGLWTVRGVTRAYFGTAGDQDRPGDYSGNGIDDIAVFRPTSGLWAVRGLTRVYFGGFGDTPVSR